MSSWSRVKVIVKNTELFKECCKKHQVGYRLNLDPNHRVQALPVYAILKDEIATSRHSEAYLCAKANEQYIPVVDNDPHWSSLTARLGPNLGLIMRDYTEMTLRASIRVKGGVVNSVQEQKDRSVLLRISIP